jgi:hypothetical protein
MNTIQSKTKASELYGKPWSKREYIIVLYHYFEHRGESHDDSSSYVQNLASIMGRTPASVAMRLHNFESLDPEVTKNRTGLQNIGPLGRDVFFYWFQKLDVLKECGEEYTREAKAASTPTLFDPDPVQMPLAFGKYEPLDEIGDGGFGKVFSCIDSTTGKHYAIKIIRTDLIADKEVLARFKREINVLKAIHHPNVIRIHEDNLAVEPHYPAFVMDLGEWSLRLYLDRNRGDSWQLDQKPLPSPDEARRIIEQILDGIEALHENTPAVVHRDIKPENVLRLADGTWAIADFGLAKFLPPSVVSTSFNTGSRKAMGTSGYAAPEQFKDFRSACHTADIYSLGVLIWELFSPAWGQLDRSDTELPEPLEKVVLKATEKKPENRQSSVAKLRSDFLAALE